MKGWQNHWVKTWKLIRTFITNIKLMSVKKNLWENLNIKGILRHQTFVDSWGKVAGICTDNQVLLPTDLPGSSQPSRSKETTGKSGTCQAQRMQSQNPDSENCQRSCDCIRNETAQKKEMREKIEAKCLGTGFCRTQGQWSNQPDRRETTIKTS